MHEDNLALEALKLRAQHNHTMVGAISAMAGVQQQEENRVQQDVHHEENRVQQDVHHEENQRQQAEFHDADMQYKEWDLAERAINLYFNASCCVLILYGSIALSLGAHYHLMSFYHHPCWYFENVPPTKLMAWIPARISCSVSVTFCLSLLCLLAAVLIVMVPKKISGVLTPVFYVFACVVAVGKMLSDPANQLLGAALLVMGIPSLSVHVDCLCFP